MEGLLITLVFLILGASFRLTWEALKLTCRFILWVINPILQEIAFQRLVKEEQAKEQRAIAAHQEALQQIDQAVAYYDRLHEQALAQADHQPSPRRSG